MAYQHHSGCQHEALDFSDPSVIPICQCQVHLYVKQHYVPLHADLYTIEGWEAGFTPSFVEGLRVLRETNDPYDWQAAMQFDVVNRYSALFKFPMFTLEFCAHILEELDHFSSYAIAQRLPLSRPNTMNRYGLILDDLPNMFDVMQELATRYVQPLSFAVPHLAQFCGQGFDHHHAFTVEYGMQKDKKLDFHVDNSQITLNVCLGKDFTDGALHFRGVRCDAHINTQNTPAEFESFDHIPGTALIHPGRARHLATKITSGERVNLILWAQSSSFLAQDAEERGLKNGCRTWCGVHQFSHPPAWMGM
eukprot:TRINITY_DN2967_c0_g1_i10.p1 TRINITY_DN2967_c0_g1~~TRINITY_DN2967_c0_g1_i10.p1  ORF type:complete len:331 (-),score=39.11 TRINITY_DN2967_c0_g1_i10:166-1083(-)